MQRHARLWRVVLGAWRCLEGRVKEQTDYPPLWQLHKLHQ